MVFCNLNYSQICCKDSYQISLNKVLDSAYFRPPGGLPALMSTLASMNTLGGFVKFCAWICKPLI